MKMFRIVMYILAVPQMALAAFTALVGSFADGGSLGERMVLVFLHPLAAIGLLVLVTQPRLSIKGIRAVTALLVANVAADGVLALLIAGGTVKGDWELPLVFAPIPAIGIAYAAMRMTSRPQQSDG